MAPNLGEVFPNFTVDTSQGRMNFHEYIQGSWAILFSHPADFTPVCTTELLDSIPSVKLAALSCDDVESHKGWIPDILAQQKLPGNDLPYPIIADPQRDLALSLGLQELCLLLARIRE